MKKFFLLAAIIFQFIILANTASADCVCNGILQLNTADKDCTGQGCSVQLVGPVQPGSNPAPTSLSNPLGPNTNSVPKLIGNIINGALGVVGSLALLMFIYGGFTWMLAAGNEQAVEKGKNILMWAAIGLVVIFASYSLVSFVINNLTGAAGG
jgi:hypothetical protein